MNEQRIQILTSLLTVHSHSWNILSCILDTEPGGMFPHYAGLMLNTDRKSAFVVPIFLGNRRYLGVISQYAIGIYHRKHRADGIGILCKFVSTYGNLYTNGRETNESDMHINVHVYRVLLSREFPARNRDIVYFV